jgi:hypothetical protein
MSEASRWRSGSAAGSDDDEGLGKTLRIGMWSYARSGWARLGINSSALVSDGL